MSIFEVVSRPLTLRHRDGRRNGGNLSRPLRIAIYPGTHLIQAIIVVSRTHLYPYNLSLINQTIGSRL